MTHRSDRVKLPASEPANPCSLKSRCARYLAPVPQYATMIGGDLPLLWFFGSYCPHFLPGGQQAQAKPKVVKPAPKGIA